MPWQQCVKSNRIIYCHRLLRLPRIESHVTSIPDMSPIIHLWMQWSLFTYISLEVFWPIVELMQCQIAALHQKESCIILVTNPWFLACHRIYTQRKLIIFLDFRLFLSGSNKELIMLNKRNKTFYIHSYKQLYIIKSSQNIFSHKQIILKCPGLILITKTR